MAKATVKTRRTNRLVRFHSCLCHFTKSIKNVVGILASDYPQLFSICDERNFNKRKYFSFSKKILPTAWGCRCAMHTRTNMPISSWYRGATWDVWRTTPPSNRQEKLEIKSPPLSEYANSWYTKHRNEKGQKCTSQSGFLRFDRNCYEKIRSWGSVDFGCTACS